MSREEEVKELVRAFLEAFCRNDLAGLEETFLHDDTVLFYGTQSNLHFLGWPAVRESFRKQVETLSGIRTSIDPATLVIRISPEGDAACIASPSMAFFAKVGGVEIGTKEMRITAVAERRDGRFRFVQLHLSMFLPEVYVK
jgi:ketosteroid isomerase-like protein